MSGMRRLTQPRAGGTNEDGAGYQSVTGEASLARDDPGSILSVPPHEYDDDGDDGEEEEEKEEEEENYIQSNSLMSTPQAGGPSTTLFGTADLSRPLTRSVVKHLFDTSGTHTESQMRLQLPTYRGLATTATTTPLEKARDIYYEVETRDEDDHESNGRNAEGVEDHFAPAESHNIELNTPRRRSERIRSQTQAAREPSLLSKVLSASGNESRIEKRKKTKSIKKTSFNGVLRRSARLSRPLDEFQKYTDLPNELKLMIWEAAVEPRLIYICNRCSTLEHAHSFGIQNKTPPWFMTCRLSVYVAQRWYKKLFGHHDDSGWVVMRPPAIRISPLRAPVQRQDVCPLVDIVIFEPCHNGCRGYFCAQQYSREDRAQVRRLAVQIDSPRLLPSSEPGWVTISRSWPNVETLFMMKPAVKGLDSSDKAMIRIMEGDHELALRKQFEEWKKGAGQDQELNTLEFVRVVEQEPMTKDIGSRYRSVEDRKTGLAEDIILG
ncbi:hypothetical protein F4802DRAFT_188628 [Xylaria palmicola]|nr:hypothetical protein F4802DRAFT_188628 [Xylaria palmicola]